MTVANSMTAEDLWRLPDDGNRHELVRGELRTMAPAGFEHGHIGVEIATRLRSHAKSYNLGVVVGADTGFFLSRNPDMVRAPDVAFVSRERIEKLGVVQKFFPGAPDLAIEVLSPNDTFYEIDEKVADFLEAGTRLVWVINPRNRTVSTHRPGQKPEVLTAAEHLDGLDVVPGFRCAIEEIFAR